MQRDPGGGGAGEGGGRADTARSTHIPLRSLRRMARPRTVGPRAQISGVCACLYAHHVCRRKLPGLGRAGAGGGWHRAQLATRRAFSRVLGAVFDVERACRHHGHRAERFHDATRPPPFLTPLRSIGWDCPTIGWDKPKMDGGGGTVRHRLWACAVSWGEGGARRTSRMVR